MTRIETLTGEQWRQVHAARAEWLRIGLSTQSVDRPAAEAAITDIYRLHGHRQPQFVHVDSPAAAALAIWLMKSATGEPIRGQLGDQLRGQLRDQLGGQLRDQLWGQLWGQLGGQLRDQLRGQLWDQLGDQLGGQLGGQLWGQLRDQLWGQAPDEIWRYMAPQSDIHWLAFYAIPRLVGVAYPEDVNDKLAAWLQVMRTCGWWWPFQNVCIISDRPAVVRTEPWAGRDGGMVRLHCPDGPSVQFRDSWGLHTWHGTRVPADLIEGDGWSVERILTERNQEVRRCAVERQGGWPWFVQAANLTAVGKAAPDPGNPGQSITLYDLPRQMFDEPVRVLTCTNGTIERDGTRRSFGLTVPAEIDDPVAAAAWTYDWPVDAYRKLARRA